MEAAAVEVAEAGAAAVPRQVRGHLRTMQRLEFRAMGSKIVAVADGDQPMPALHHVPTWFEEWEQILSRFRLDSELSRLNASPGSSIEVSPVLWEVYAAALRAYELTGGLVNPLILEQVIAAGYDRSFDEMSNRILAGVAPVGIAEGHDRSIDEGTSDPGGLIVDAQSHQLRLPNGSGLDFGGVAKGWAANEAVIRLGRSAPALVSAGGDVAVSGPRANGQPWQVAVEDPFHAGGFVENIYVSAGGVATSGRDRRRWVQDGVARHHVIDPRTGTSANTDIMSATVIARDAIQAEALAKAVLILGSAAGMDWLEGIQGAAGLLVHESGELLYSSAMDEYL